MSDVEDENNKDQGGYKTPPLMDNRIRVKSLQRAQVLRKLQNEHLNIVDLESLSLAQLEVKASLLDRHYQSFEPLQAQLENLDESQFEGNHRDEGEQAYFEVRSCIAEKMASHRQHQDTFMSSTQQIASLHPVTSKNSYLPKLQLSKFSGIHREWLEFFNMFKALVHNDNELSPLAKFQYLRSCLTDQAARLIQSLDITPENYTKAIDMLMARYDNKRYIFQSHIVDMFSIKTVQKPSMESLRDFIDSTNSNLRAIQSLASDTQVANGVLLHLVVSKLDIETQSKWEEEVSQKWDKPGTQTLHLPTWDNLASFLERRCKAMDIIQIASHQPSKSLQHHNNHHHNTPHNRSRHSSKTGSPKSTSSFIVPGKHSSPKCSLCDESPWHYAFKCAKFLNFNSLERYNLIKSKKLCLNCLSASHIANKCPSLNRCQKCRSSHHTLLHREQTSAPASPPPPNRDEVDPQQSLSPSQPSVALKVSELKSEVLLGTARVLLCSCTGIEAVGRALLDSASQLNFITERMAHQLRLPRKQINIEVNGIGEISAVAQQMCSLKVQSLAGEFSREINAIMLPSITSHQPYSKVNISNWNLPDNIKLADESFNTPGAIDLLLGTQVFYRLLMVGQIQGESALVLQKITADSCPRPSAMDCPCRLCQRHGH